jgi:hypothetical protein
VRGLLDEDAASRQNTSMVSGLLSQRLRRRNMTASEAHCFPANITKSAREEEPNENLDVLLPGLPPLVQHKFF